MTEGLCARTICRHEYHPKECRKCGSIQVRTKGRTGRSLFHYEWVCPEFVPVEMGVDA